MGRLLRPGAPSPGGQFKGTPPLVPVFDFSYDATLRSVEESLARLGLDRIDMLLIHDPDQHYDAARSGAYPALERLRSEGVVSAIGVGMNQVELLVRFARETDVDCLLVAGRYTLLDQEALTELLPLCLARGVAVIAGGVFNSGILARPAAGAPYNYEPAADEIVERALGHPAVACVLTGCRSVAELEENIGLFELELPNGLWPALKMEGLLREAAPMPSPSRL